MMARTLASLFPTPASFQKKIFLTPDDQNFILESRQSIQNILFGEDPRFLLLVGPCSIHDLEETLEYGRRLKELADAIKDKIFIVMRSYVEKPRTSLGWKGFLYDPYLDGSCNLETGILQTRELFSSLTQLKLPLGAELLEPITASFYADFLSWGCIGARTSASPLHRQMASSFPFAMGFKNNIDGNLDVAIHGMLTASKSHVFVSSNLHGQLALLTTQGNPCCHIVLRGGEQKPNYFPEDVARAIRKCSQTGVCKQVMIDCSHGNSRKQYLRQKIVFESAIEQRLQGTTSISALMLESFLEEGAQPIDTHLRRGVSITDPCLSWQMTEELVLQAYQELPAVELQHFPIMV